MAKQKFTINKESLVEASNQDFALTRVPHSKAGFYLLLHKDDIISADEKTLVAEFDTEKKLNILTGMFNHKPTLEEAINEYNNPADASIQMTAAQLYDDYYKYSKKADPLEKAKKDAERAQHRAQAEKQALNKESVQEGKKEFAQDKVEANKNIRESMKKIQQNGKSETDKVQNNRQQSSPEQQTSPEPERMPEQKKYFNKEQFQEIKKGVKRRLDTKLYSDVRFNAAQMRELRLAQQAGVDITKYNNPVIKAEHMRELRLGAANGVELDLTKLDQTLYNANQIRELRLGFEKGLDVNTYLDPAYSAEQMHQIRLGQQAGLATGQFQDIHYTADQMAAIRHQLVFQNIKEILKKTLGDFRDWIAEKTTQIIENIKAHYKGRDPKTPEEIQDARMDMAVEDIKETLYQSELIDTEEYQDIKTDEILKDNIMQAVENIKKHPEQDLDSAANKTARDICKDTEIGDISQSQEKIIYAKSTEEAVEEVMSQQEYEEQMLEEYLQSEIEMGG